MPVLDVYKRQHLLLAVGIGKAVGLGLDGRDKGKCPPVHIAVSDTHLIVKAIEAQQ